MNKIIALHTNKVPQDIPVIISSGVSARDGYFNNIPVDDLSATFIGKPVNISKLIATIKDLVGEGGSVYYLEDEATVSMMMTTILTRSGFDIQHFENPEAFLEATQGGVKPNSMILTDNDMGTPTTGARLVLNIRKGRI